MGNINSGPRLFIGSSREARKYALAVQHALEGLQEDLRAVVWNQGLFRPGSATLETLLKALDGFDFAAFVFAPTDVTKMRESVHATVRDNVIFELGLFMGRIGKERSFFITPVGVPELHVPSDLLGITAATYDPEEKDVERAVRDACFDIFKVVEELGALHPGETVLFDSSEGLRLAHFRGVESYIYKGKERVGQKAEGALSIEDGDVLRVDRSGTEGKYEIQLRPEGRGVPSFAKRYPPSRGLRITCEAKAEGGEHSLRFVAKDEKQGNWLADDKKTVRPGDWTKVDVRLSVDSTKDFLFRIDDHAAHAPSKVSIRNLIIAEENI
jgi:hypothetical protein